MRIRNAVMAAAVAGLFVTGAASTAVAADDSHEGKVKCEGVNQCKGHGACKTAHNACSGQNGCKGQSHVWLSPEECAKQQAAMKK